MSDIFFANTLTRGPLPQTTDGNKRTADVFNNAELNLGEFETVAPKKIRGSEANSAIEISDDDDRRTALFTNLICCSSMTPTDLTHLIKDVVDGAAGNDNAIALKRYVNHSTLLDLIKEYRSTIESGSTKGNFSVISVLKALYYLQSVGYRAFEEVEGGSAEYVIDQREADVFVQSNLPLDCVNVAGENGMPEIRLLEKSNMFCFGPLNNPHFVLPCFLPPIRDFYKHNLSAGFYGKIVSGKAEDYGWRNMPIKLGRDKQATLWVGGDWRASKLVGKHFQLYISDPNTRSSARLNYPFSKEDLRFFNAKLIGSKIDKNEPTEIAGTNIDGRLKKTLEENALGVLYETLVHYLNKKAGLENNTLVPPLRANTVAQNQPLNPDGARGNTAPKNYLTLFDQSTQIYASGVKNPAKIAEIMHIPQQEAESLVAYLEENAVSFFAKNVKLFYRQFFSGQFVPAPSAAKVYETSVKKAFWAQLETSFNLEDTAQKMSIDMDTAEKWMLENKTLSREFGRSLSRATDNRNTAPFHTIARVPAHQPVQPKKNRPIFHSLVNNAQPNSLSAQQNGGSASQRQAFGSMSVNTAGVNMPPLSSFTAPPLIGLQPQAPGLLGEQPNGVDDMVNYAGGSALLRTVSTEHLQHANDRASQEIATRLDEPMEIAALPREENGTNTLPNQGIEDFLWFLNSDEFK